MSNHRIPNHRIDSMLVTREEFDNYNGTIHGWHELNSTPASPVGTRYIVKHWRTIIAEIDDETGEILDLAYGFISQTTSTLVGRILRSLPAESVHRYLSTIPKHDAQRLARMARLS